MGPVGPPSRRPRRDAAPAVIQPYKHVPHLDVIRWQNDVADACHRLRESEVTASVEGPTPDAVAEALVFFLVHHFEGKEHTPEAFSNALQAEVPGTSCAFVPLRALLGDRRRFKM